jgi:hypothetical protein
MSFFPYKTNSLIQIDLETANIESWLCLDPEESILLNGTFASESM